MKELEVLFSELSEAVNNSEELRKLFNEAMIETFESISSSDGELSNTYKEQSDKLTELLKSFENLVNHRLAESTGKSELAKAEYSLKILKHMQEGISTWENNFKSFISAIEEAEKKNNSSSDKAEGGALKRQLEVRLRKH